IDIRQMQKTGDVTPAAKPDRGGPPVARGPRRDGDAPRGPATSLRPDRAPGGGHPGGGGGGEDDDKKKGVGGVIGRDSRHKSRQGRHRGGSRGDPDRADVVIGADGGVDLIEQKSGSRRGPRAALINKMRRRQQQSAVKKEGPVEIAMPITVRSLSEAIGMKAG